jgi:hypothetical protein
MDQQSVHEIKFISPTAIYYSISVNSDVINHTLQYLLTDHGESV